MKTHLTIATRGSRLALWQAEYVKRELCRLHPGLDIELSVIRTQGDIIQNVPLAKIGGKGLFVKEIEEALLAGRADLAVHSIKDVPMILPDGLLLGCVPKRAIANDCLLSRDCASLEALPGGAVIGTSSLRRSAQLLAGRPDLDVRSLRGNVDTRLRKLMDGEFDAILLACAALGRLDLHAPCETVLSFEECLPAVGQGALGIECRADDYDMLVYLAELEDSETRLCVEAERAFLRRLDGGCQVPIAGHAEITGETLSLTGLVAEVSGRTCIRETLQGSVHDADAIGTSLAETVLGRGGKEILEALYQQEITA